MSFAGRLVALEYRSSDSFYAVLSIILTLHKFTNLCREYFSYSDFDLLWLICAEISESLTQLSPLYKSFNAAARYYLHRLRVFENRVLRRIFRSQRGEVTGGWRTPHNEELHNLHASPNIIRVTKSRRMRWVGIQHEWKRWDAYNILVRKPVGKRPLGRPRHRWKDNTRMDLKEKV
jgi:hypothetical protein